MPDLQFSVPFKSREGHCPDCDGWSFHHVLPVRYFWSTAFILVKLIRLQQCKDTGGGSQTASSSKTARSPRRGGSSKSGGSSEEAGPNLNKEFGTNDALGFCQELTLKRQELIALCESLHRTPDNNTARQSLESADLDLSNSETIAAIAHDLTGPKYGGFAGMKPDQRTDDPGSHVEPQRPLSFNQDQWTELQNLAQVLEESLGKRFKKESNGPFPCTLDHDKVSRLLHCLRILRNRFGRGVHPFKPSDWQMKDRPSWYYISGIPKKDLQAFGRAAICGDVFNLDDDGTRGGIQKTTDTLGDVGRGAAIVTRNEDAKDQMQFVERLQQ
jgi:hypothetical protein